MIYQTVSMQKARNNLAEIVDKVAIAGEKFVVTKFGKVKAMIVPVSEKVTQSKEERKKILGEVAGIWKNRKDIGDPDQWVRKMRKPRYEKISS